MQTLAVAEQASIISNICSDTLNTQTTSSVQHILVPRILYNTSCKDKLLKNQLPVNPIPISKSKPSSTCKNLQCQCNTNKK